MQVTLYPLQAKPVNSHVPLAHTKRALANLRVMMLMQDTMLIKQASRVKPLVNPERIIRT